MHGSYALEQSPRLIPLLASFLLLQSPQQMTTWERLNPKSFISTVYLRCQVVHHTWFLYFVPQQGRESDTRIPRVGRVLDVVDSIDKVPGGEKFPAIQEPFQEVYLAAVPENKGPLQFVRVNVLKSRSLFSDGEFPLVDKIRFLSANGSADGWQVVVQLEEDDWILADAFFNQSFVFPEDDVLSHGYNDCQGMCNFFVLGHCCAQNGRISPIPKQACPPFPGQLKGFFDYLSVDQCQAIFHSIRHIGCAMQRLPCRIAQS